MAEVSELPSGFSEIRQAERQLHITQTDIPWLPKAKKEQDINLVHVRLVGGGEFYFGNTIRDDRLIIAAESLDAGGLNRSQIANQMLYSRLPTFIRDGHHPGIRPVYNARTEWAMYEAGNGNGERVFFVRTRLDKLQDIPVIIRVAVCDKSMERVVLGVITTSSKKRIKQTARL